MSISANFNIFCDDLKVSAKKESIISLRYNSINKKLNKDFWNMNTNYGGIYIGCYGRETANDGIEEIDMIFEMPSHLQVAYEKRDKNGQAILFEDVRRSIAAVYPKTTIDKEKQSIKVKFSDEMSFNILPCFINSDESCIFPNTTHNGSWDTRNPLATIKAVQYGDRLTNHNLKKLCRIVKAWKQHCDVKIKDVLIDTLVYEFLVSSNNAYNSYSYFDVMCRDFFKFLMRQKPSKITWNTIGSNDVISNLDNFRYKAIIAYYNAETAVKLEKEGEKWAASQKWKEIFGCKFPESIDVESQIKKLFEKTSLLHTTQKKCAQILRQRAIAFRSIQFLMATFILLGILVMEYTENFNFGLTLFIASSLIFVINLYFKKYDLLSISAKHMQSASQTILLEKEFQSLLNDFTHHDVDISIIREKKEVLQQKMINIYTGTSKFISKRYFQTRKILNSITEVKEKLPIIDTPRIHIPTWQGNNFYMENQEQYLMNYKNKII
ncbi:hypothetical protein [Aquimarina sp. RZ0]|uniref:SMODS domain-containing nucleotidyltransferase n=1 Tax=Aquimarina sp. RZ0 TaxID=2607730 RepID=UPI0011F3A6A7|nr:hypothetical protein [Aquimarina sp. RZ0]KAA1243359.1 hypothetical protein F0000_21375 [Aquimarina sp. RZ0]